MSVTWIVRCSECGGFGAAEFYVDEELEATDIEQIKEKLFEYQANDYFPPMDSAYNCCKLRSSMQMYVGIDCDLCYKPAGKYAIDNTDPDNICPCGCSPFVTRLHGRPA